MLSVRMPSTFNARSNLRKYGIKQLQIILSAPANSAKTIPPQPTKSVCFGNRVLPPLAMVVLQNCKHHLAALRMDNVNTCHGISKQSGSAKAVQRW